MQGRVATSAGRTCVTKDQILQTQEALEGLRSQLADENRKLDSKKNEHDLLKSLVDTMEGYPESVKFLHNNEQWKVEAPLLSDIIYCKEEYRTGKSGGSGDIWWSERRE